MRYFALAAVLFISVVFTSLVQAGNELVNFALNKSYTSTEFHSGNSYGNCADEDDPIQLTDGHTTIGQEGKPFFWFRKSSVGWIGKPWINIEIDLEKICPVEKVTYTTSTGIHGFFWPKNIYVLTSIDGKLYHLSTDIMEDNAGKLPGYASKGIESPILYKLESKQLNTKARYVKLVINQLNYIQAADEIEVLGNPDEMPSNQEGLAVIGEGKELYTKVKYSSRILSELEMFKTLGKKAGLDFKGISAKIKRELAEFTSKPLDYKTFSTVVPFTDIDFEMLKINSKLLNAQGLDGIKVWTANKWDPVDVYSQPEETHLKTQLFMANGERRGKVFNVTNCSGKNEIVKISVKADNEIMENCGIKLRKVLCNDNQMNVLVYNILDKPFDKIQNNSVMIPAGMTQQFWIDFEPQNLKPGDHRLKVEISKDFFDNKTIVFNINTGKFDFPDRLTLGLGMWDYITTATAEKYQFTKQQQNDILDIIEEYQYNCPWVSGSVLPAPDDTYFDEDENLIKRLDFSKIDNWIDTFANAQNYFITGLRSSIGSVNLNDNYEIYKKRMAATAEALNEHILSKNISQFIYLLPGDEPHTAAQQERFVKIAQAVKSGVNSGNSKIKIFVDTVHGYPETDADFYNGESIYTISDNICSHHQIFLNFLNRSDSQHFYSEKIKNGKEFSFYSTLTPSKSFDPYTYYLLQQWISFKFKATYSGYWQFYDMPGDSTFNDYAIDKLVYCPFYCDAKEIYITKQWKAIHEGRQDYEYLRMLEAEIEASVNSNEKEALSSVLDNALNKTAEPFIDYYSTEVSMWDANPEIYRTDYHWLTQKDRTASQKYINEIWKVLDNISRQSRNLKKVYRISDFGAVADDGRYDSKAINIAIKTCSKNGGGAVILGAGKFLCKSIELKSNVELRLSDETVLFFSNNFSDYPIRPVRHEGVEIMGYSALIWACEAENITITGKGTIDGNGQKWWQFYRKYKHEFKNDLKMTPIDEHHEQIINVNQKGPKRSVGWFFPRPMTIDFRNCRNIVLEDFTIKDSPFWMIHPTYCENVLISGIKTIADGPNTDGVDPDSSKNVIIEKCTFYNGDDCIAIKSGYNEDGLRINKSTENIIIRNCVMNYSDASSIAIGSETSGGIKNILIENCVLKNADRAIRIKTARGRGGVVEGVRINNLQIHDIKKKVIEITAMYNSSSQQQVNKGTPRIRDIKINNIQCSSKKADWFCEITGLIEMPFEDFLFKDIYASAKRSISCTDAKNISFTDVTLDTTEKQEPRLKRTSEFTWEKR